MTDNDVIEKRAINRFQVEYVLGILQQSKCEDKNKLGQWYNLRRAYKWKEFLGLIILLGAKSEKRILCLEDMFDVCYE
jgi:hypothetical protein